MRRRDSISIFQHQTAESSTMQYVPLESEERLSLQSLHRFRSRLVGKS